MPILTLANENNPYHTASPLEVNLNLSQGRSSVEYGGMIGNMITAVVFIKLAETLKNGRILAQ
jgi:3-hydroxy-3-methylglutaryl CoA synthase